MLFMRKYFNIIAEPFTVLIQKDAFSNSSYFYNLKLVNFKRYEKNDFLRENLPMNTAEKNFLLASSGVKSNVPNLSFSSVFESSIVLYTQCSKRNNITIH